MVCISALPGHWAGAHREYVLAERTGRRRVRPLSRRGPGFSSVNWARLYKRHYHNTACTFGLLFPMSHPGQSVFQPREGDLCTWVDQSQFFDLDDEIQEEDYALQELLSGYKIVAAALQKANLRFAAIGGIALAVLGGRSSDNMTHDVDLVFNGTVVQLFDTLRITKGYDFRHSKLLDLTELQSQVASKERPSDR